MTGQPTPRPSPWMDFYQEVDMSVPEPTPRTVEDAAHAYAPDLPAGTPGVAAMAANAYQRIRRLAYRTGWAEEQAAQAPTVHALITVLAPYLGTGLTAQNAAERVAALYGTGPVDPAALATPLFPGDPLYGTGQEQR